MLRVVKVEKVNMNERILAVYCGEGSTYIGLGNKLVNYSKDKIMCIHEKSIRCISGSDMFIGCCSYDGKATVFSKDDKYIDVIEGPDTEIKGIAFQGNVIALTTRGKTTWILEDLEITKIIDDHTQDVKGCVFHNSRLYTWSYDCTVKVYDLFVVDHSWELSQSIEFEDIVWKIVFFNEKLCVCLNNGTVVVKKQCSYLWEDFTELALSATPIFTGVVFLDYVGFICNRNTLLILDSNFDLICEVPDLNSGCDIFSCSYSNRENAVITGSDDGCLSKVLFAEEASSE